MFNTALSGEAEPDTQGTYTSEAEAQTEGHPQKELLYLVLLYDPESSATLAPSDRLAVQRRLLGIIPPPDPIDQMYQLLRHKLTATEARVLVYGTETPESILETDGHVRETLRDLRYTLVPVSVVFALVLNAECSDARLILDWIRCELVSLVHHPTFYPSLMRYYGTLTSLRAILLQTGRLEALKTLNPGDGISESDAGNILIPAVDHGHTDTLDYTRLKYGDWFVRRITIPALAGDNPKVVNWCLDTYPQLDYEITHALAPSTFELVVALKQRGLLTPSRLTLYNIGRRWPDEFLEIMFGGKQPYPPLDMVVHAPYEFFEYGLRNPNLTHLEIQKALDVVGLNDERRVRLLNML
jgi:hypothetical protein